MDLLVSLVKHNFIKKYRYLRKKLTEKVYITNKIWSIITITKQIIYNHKEPYIIRQLETILLIIKYGNYIFIGLEGRITFNKPQLKLMDHTRYNCERYTIQLRSKKKPVNFK